MCRLLLFYCSAFKAFSRAFVHTSGSFLPEREVFNSPHIPLSTYYLHLHIFEFAVIFSLMTHDDGNLMTDLHPGAGKDLAVRES